MENETLKPDILKGGLSKILGGMGEDNVIDLQKVDNVSGGEFTLPEKLPSQDIPQDVISRTASLVERVSPTDQATTQEVARLQGERADLSSRLRESFSDVADISSMQIETEREAGLGELAKDVTGINNQIREKELDFRRERERITTTPGLTVAQRNARLADVQRKQASELADLAIVQQSKLANYEVAQSMVDRKVELLTQERRFRLEATKFFYEENKALLTDKENKLFQQKLQKDQFQLNQLSNEIQRVETTKLDLLKNANINNAPDGVLMGIQNAKTSEEAYRIAGRYGVSVQDRLNMLRMQDLKMDMRKKMMAFGLDKSLGYTMEDISKNKNAQKATSLIEVFNVLKQYEGKVKDIGRYATKRERKEAEAFVTTVLAPTLAVAQGQGALQKDEAENYKNQLGVGGIFKRKSVTKQNIQTVVEAIQNKLGTNLEAVDSVFPEASTNYELFKSYMVNSGDSATNILTKEIANSLRDSGYGDMDILQYALADYDESVLQEAQSLLNEGYNLTDIINSY